uniref:Collagen type VI alpha 1 chain n=1 Tax=Cynoglossus semilaevis TaxID=244447 RepID=A0A3P8VF47_CYNSE
MGALRGLVAALLCVFLTGAQTQVQRNRLAECPVDLYFVLDTSESVALRQKPPNFYIDQIKEFTKRFIDELKNIQHYHNKYLAQDTRLSLIATDQNYRQNFTAADDTRSTKMGTIRTIIDIIVCSILISSLLLSVLSSALLWFPVSVSGRGVLSDFVCAGSVGDPGPVGYSGMKGDKGERGRDGIDGRKGEAGFPGLAGCKGSPGSDGLQGEPGPKGDPGPYGQKGGKGDPGRNGDPGRPGNYGPLGSRGDPGPRGADGDKGERGDDGAPGPDGPRGDKGTPGEKGEQGARGNRGPRGELVSHETSLKKKSTGELVSHETSGPKGPRGIKGAPGDRGPMGERGVDGDPGNGTTGCHGFQGNPGPRGDVGEPGGNGTPGPKGDDGEPGDPGPDNNQPGPAGPKGAKGHRGPEGKPCKCEPLDLAFIVDSSESIGASNFALAKDFIITVIDRLIKDQQFAGNESRVSVVQYSGAKAQEVVQLGTNAVSLTEFKQAVRDLRWLAEATYTGEALDFALNNTIKLMRQENRVVLVLTDGRSDIIRDKVPLNVLCGKNIRVGGLGVKDYSGRVPNQEQLGDVVCKSDPKPGFSFVLDNFAELLDDTFLQNLTSRICQDKRCPDYKCPITFNEGADILVMMDSSASVGQKNFETSKTFVRRLADRFFTAKRSPGANVKVGVAQYSRSAKMEQGLTTNYTLLSSKVEEAAFQNDGTNVLEAMEFAIRNLQGRGDSSAGVRKLVLFSDGRSQGVTGPVLEKRVREVADAGVQLYVIAVGSQVNEANLRTLVSRGRPDDISYAQRHLIRVSDYPSLLHGVFAQTVSRRVSLR